MAKLCLKMWMKMWLIQKTWHKPVLNIARRQNSKISQGFGCIGEMFHVKEWKCSKDKKFIK